MLLPIAARIVTDSNAPRTSSIEWTLRAAVVVMTAQVAEHPGPLRVGIGHADAPGSADALERSRRPFPNLSETIGYLVGPSVAACTGAGTFGAVYHPI